MLKNRLIPALFLKHGFLVRSEQFHIHQNLGNPLAQVERYNDWDVDELIYIDLSATPPALVPIKERSTYVEMEMEGRLSAQG